MGIKTYQEKNTRAMEKELAQSDIPVKRKIKKPSENTIFHEVVFSDVFGPNGQLGISHLTKTTTSMVGI